MRREACREGEGEVTKRLLGARISFRSKSDKEPRAVLVAGAGRGEFARGAISSGSGEKKEQEQREVGLLRLRKLRGLRFV